ncbi:hypothetical protein ACLOJK_035005, partial [Asimina triloba]
TLPEHRFRCSIFLMEPPSDCRSRTHHGSPKNQTKKSDPNLDDLHPHPAPSDPSMVGATAKPTRSSDHGAVIGACLPPISRSRSVAHRRQQLPRPPLARPAISSEQILIFSSRGPPRQQLDGNEPAAMGCEIPKSSSASSPESGRTEIPAASDAIEQR